MVLGFLFAGAPQAQTKTTTDVRKFEIIAVDGNNLVVRNESGTHEYVVPDDFRFTVDGRKVSVKELKPGMKGTATVATKTTTITPVTVTEIKEGTVVSATTYTVNVRTSEGVRRFTQSELDDRGVQILKDGRNIRIRDLRQGDQITATIISKAPPVVLTETEVQATLAQAAPATPAAAAPTQAAAAPSGTAPPAAPAPTTTATPPQPQATEGTPWVWYIVIAIALALLWFFLARKKEKS
jgi:flagellar hook assembly protein FlgD